jgi:hypothetical protein
VSSGRVELLRPRKEVLISPLGHLALLNLSQRLFERFPAC